MLVQLMNLHAPLNWHNNTLTYHVNRNQCRAVIQLITVAKRYELSSIEAAVAIEDSRRKTVG